MRMYGIQGSTKKLNVNAEQLQIEQTTSKPTPNTECAVQPGACHALGTQAVQDWRVQQHEHAR